jgi:quercetin dioxygenase-like cupin family protein
MPTRRHLPDLEAEPHAEVFPGEEPKTVRLSLEAGDRVPRHSHPDREIVCYVLEGTVEMTLGESTHALDSGDVVRFDGDQDISPRAVTDARALLVLAQRADG